MRCPRLVSTSALQLDTMALAARADGRQDALAMALLRYLKRAVGRSLGQRGVDACHVDDLVQDICMRIWIAYRVRWSVGDRLRQMFRSPLIDPDHIELADLQGTEDRLEEGLRERALLGLSGAVRRLPARERACIEGTLAGDKLRVMATRLGVDASSVCRLRKQAVAQLGELMKAAA
jgi:DNA-directed RNA polymerase specialized sigma24 family protein